MWCALLSPLHLEIHFVHTIPWNDVPSLLKRSPKFLIMSVRRCDKKKKKKKKHSLLLFII